VTSSENALDPREKYRGGADVISREVPLCSLHKKIAVRIQERVVSPSIVTGRKRLLDILANIVQQFINSPTLSYMGEHVLDGSWSE
jgi:hypothetical protein